MTFGIHEIYEVVFEPRYIVETRLRGMAATSTSSVEVMKHVTAWCFANIKGRFAHVIDKGIVHMWFENETDAALFKIFWSTPARLA